MKPNSPFLDEPRAQNQFRNEFIRQIGQAPQAEPLNLLADDLHKVSQIQISWIGEIVTVFIVIH